MTLFRLSATQDAIEVEHWPGWAAFDASPTPNRGLWCDLAYAVDLPRDTLSAEAGVFELRRLRVQNGQMAAVEAFLAADAAAWRAAGAVAAASFKVVHGDDMPACLVLLGWTTLAAALAAQPRFESAPAAVGARRSGREAHGLSVVRSSRRVLRARLRVEGKGEVM
jgi:hypothetical protein